MPWRDIAARLKGAVVKGMRKHFLQFWNFNNIQFSEKTSITQNEKRGTVMKEESDQLSDKTVLS